MGCRQRGPKAQLLRVVRASDSGVRPDAAGSARGRGAYVHRDPGCVERAVSRGALARALRASLAPEEAARLRVGIERIVGK